MSMYRKFQRSSLVALILAALSPSVMLADNQFSNSGESAPTLSGPNISSSTSGEATFGSSSSDGFNFGSPTSNGSGMTSPNSGDQGFTPPDNTGLPSDNTPIPDFNWSKMPDLNSLDPAIRERIIAGDPFTVGQNGEIIFSTPNTFTLQPGADTHHDTSATAAEKPSVNIQIAQTTSKSISPAISALLNQPDVVAFNSQTVVQLAAGSTSSQSSAASVVNGLNAQLATAVANGSIGNIAPLGTVGGTVVSQNAFQAGTNDLTPAATELLNNLQVAPGATVTVIGNNSAKTDAAVAVLQKNGVKAEQIKVVAASTASPDTLAVQVSGQLMPLSNVLG